MDNGGTGAIGDADRFLSTAALVGLVVSQPLLDLLGRTPRFFVARAAPILDVILVGLVVGLVIPLWFGALVAQTGRVNRRAGVWLHHVVIALAAALLTMAVLDATPAGEADGRVLVASAGIAGVLAVAGYQRWAGLRAALRYAAAVPLVITFWFLLLAPTAGLVWGTPAEATPVAAVTGGAPVVMVVFDELPVATLIDSEGNLRGDLFPGFARLAADGTWFRNAVTVRDGTADSLPTIVSGIAAPPDRGTPSSVDHPDTLFTLVGDGYRVRAIESVTELCPIRVCVDGTRLQPPLRERWSALAGDLAVITGHVVLPDNLTGDLPPIDRGWSDFIAAGGDDGWAHEVRFNREVQANRSRIATEFVGGLDRSLDDAELHFLHILLPHSPWALLPDGRRHGAPNVAPGEGPVLSDDAWLVEQSYQWHLLQVQYVDRFVTDLIETLEAHGSYDEALVVVTADHGVAIRPGLDRRKVSDANVGDVAAIPLFVKRPGPRHGDISDYRAETTDILPTIGAALGVEVPWVTDGVDLFGATLPERSASTVMGDDRSVTFGASGEEKLEVARYHQGWFGGGGPYQLAPAGYRDLLGGEVGAFVAAPAPGIEVTVDQDYPPPDPDADPIPAYMSGTLHGAPAADHVLAIALQGRIVAVTRTWDDGGTTRFQAMLPPDSLDSSSTPALYLVRGTETDRALEPLGG